MYPTNITAVRQAIADSINYTSFINEVMAGQGTQFVGPEVPTFPYYDLGNLPPYQYNLNEAAQVLKAANINPANLPPLVIRTIAGCEYCTTAAQILQADLAQANFTSTVEVVEQTTYWGPYGNAATNIKNAAQEGQISFLGGENWASLLDPADDWEYFVSQKAVWGNWAGYTNPVVQACSNAFVNGTSPEDLLNICTKAQAQAYNDVPYIYFLPHLWDVDGSLVWLKNGPIQSFLLDPTMNGFTTLPIFNTVTFNTPASTNAAVGSPFAPLAVPSLKLESQVALNL
jgi:ABC-type transport system substrate-binding protein